MKESSTRGGKRPGAGRKPLPKEEKKGNLTIKIKPENYDFLGQLAEAKGISIGALVEELVETKRRGWSRLSKLKAEKMSNVKFRFTKTGEVYTYLRYEDIEVTYKAMSLGGREFMHTSREMRPIVMNEDGEEKMLTARDWDYNPIEIIWK
jgi:hypothetical protein